MILELEIKIDYLNILFNINYKYNIYSSLKMNWHNN